MCTKGSVFTFVLIVLCVVFANVSEGFEVNPTQAQIDQAITFGKVNQEDIFKTKHVAPATFGNWPTLGSGLIETKLVRLAVVSAMKIRAKKGITEEEAQEIVNSESLMVRYRGGPDVYKIKLKQGTKIIGSIKIEKPDFTDKDVTKHNLFIVAYFPYSKLDPNANTSIIIEKDFGAREFKVDFSSIK